MYHAFQDQLTSVLQKQRVCKIITYFLLFLLTPSVMANTYYVSLLGNDKNGNGSFINPWRTIEKATTVVPANQGHTIHVGAGIFKEGNIKLPEGVSLEGEGADLTTIQNNTYIWGQGALQLISTKVTSRGAIRFTHEGTPYTYDKKESIAGNQTLSGFTLDGMGKKSYQGIQLVNRNNVKIFNIKVQAFYYSGIELGTSGHATVKDVEIYNFLVRESSLEHTGASYGNIQLRGDMNNVRIHDGTVEHLTQSGYAIKSLRSWEDYGRLGDYLTNVKFYNIKQKGKSTAPWANYTAPNIGFEFWNINADGVEIANCDFSCGLSLEYNAPVRSYPYSFWVHDNKFKVAHGSSVEFACSNIVMEKNYFDLRDNTNAWNVLGEFNSGHQKGTPIVNSRVNHNIFDLGNRQPSLCVFTTKIIDFKFYNNTVYNTGSRPTLMELRRTFSNGSSGIKVKNNIFDIDNTQYPWQFIIFVEGNNGVLPANTEYVNNFHRVAPSQFPGGIQSSNNKITTAGLKRAGDRLKEFFQPMTGSNAINAGVNVGLPFAGSAPDMGALEIGSTSQPTPPANNEPTISITAPANNATINTGATVTITVATANANGSVKKVEFFNGSNKLGESKSSPFSFAWKNPVAGSYTLTAKATDKSGTAATSAPIAVTIKAPNTPVDPNPKPDNTSTFYRAINLNGPATTIDGKSWQGSNAGNYTFKGNSFSSQNITLKPSTDGNRANMIRSSIWSPNLSLTLTSVPVAEYEVYIYVWEDNNAETYSISLEGKVVKQKFKSGGAGSWAKLGPFKSIISDGTINVTTAGGAANLSGIEVWKTSKKVQANTSQPIAGAPSSPSKATCSATGTILREFWTNLAGTSIADIPVNQNNNGSASLTIFETPSNVGTNYGSRIRGYICPPATGSYTFWIAGDDNCELYLSTNDDPANKVKIAYVPGYTDARQWDKYREQKSVVITLQAGKKYYVEALHKEGYGSDNLAVGWQMPDGNIERPIAGSHLSPVTVNNNSNALRIPESVSIFPNPANNVTTLQFEAIHDQDIQITLTNMLSVQVLSVTKRAAAGKNEIELDLTSVATGMYIVSVQKDGKTITGKLSVSK